MSKYHNIKVTIDNNTFDSKREAQRYLDLKLLQKGKEIKELQLQPQFDLYAGIKYIADFSYLDKKYNWDLVVEDVKGMKTEVYKIKKKLFKYKYPSIIFLET